MLRKISDVLRKLFKPRPAPPSEPGDTEIDTGIDLQRDFVTVPATEREDICEKFLNREEYMKKERRTESRGVNLIKHFEGCRLEAYKPVPTEEYYTIGYGHYGPDVHRGDRITSEWAEQLLRKDLAKFEKAVNKLVKVPLTQNQFDALVSFTYNLGETKFADSTLLKVVNANPKDNDGVRKQLLRWVNAGGRELPGLVRRREAEANLYALPSLE